MTPRRGMGKGKGKGYKNITGKDPRVHSDSARGRKQPQRIRPIPHPRIANIWRHQKQLATWSNKKAKILEKMLKPYVGKKVFLYGGSFIADRTGYVATLKKLEVRKPTYYRQDTGEPYTPAGDLYIVEATLKAEDWKSGGAMFSDVVYDKKGMPKDKEKLFKPRLGSWKIAIIQKGEAIPLEAL